MTLKLSLDFSVIISAYNRKNFLLSAVKSAINQTLELSRFEIIVVKNFEDQEIDSFLEDYGIQHHVINESILGMSIVSSVKFAKGTYVAFLDDDDEFARKKLESLLSVFESDPDPCYVHNAHEVIDENGHHLGFSLRSGPEKEEIINIYTKGSRFQHFIDGGGDFNLSSISVKRKKLEDCYNLFNAVSSNSDTLVFACCLNSGDNIISIPDPLTFYRYHESTSASVTGQRSLNLAETFYRPSIESLGKLFEFSKSKSMRNLLRTRIYEYKIRSFLSGNIVSRIELVRSSLSLAIRSLSPLSKYKLFISVVGLLTSIYKPLGALVTDHGEIIKQRQFKGR